SIAWSAACASKVVVSNSAAARSRKLLAWTFIGRSFPDFLTARIWLAPDLRHRLPGPELEHREAGGIEHGAAADHDVGRGDAAVSAERPRGRPGLRLGGDQPDHAGEHLPERVVGDVAQPVRFDRIGAERGNLT